MAETTTHDARLVQDEDERRTADGAGIAEALPSASVPGAAAMGGMSDATPTGMVGVTDSGTAAGFGAEAASIEGADISVDRALDTDAGLVGAGDRGAVAAGTAGGASAGANDGAVGDIEAASRPPSETSP